MDKPAACIEGVSIGPSDNYAGPSLNLIQRNVPQSNITWSDSKVVTVTVFSNLYEEKIPLKNWKTAPVTAKNFNSLSCTVTSL